MAATGQETTLRLSPEHDPGSSPSRAIADAHTVISVEPAY